MGRPKAQVICNPTSGGGAYDPEEIRNELDGKPREEIGRAHV